MDKQGYKKALDAACADLECALEQRDELDKRIAALKRTIFALTQLCEDKPTQVFMQEWADEIGLTSGCREVLKSLAIPFTPVQLRDHLKAVGFDLTKYSSPLASIHSVLKRLVEGGEVEIVPKPDGTDGYRWKSSRPTLLSSKRRRARFRLRSLRRLSARAQAMAGIIEPIVKPETGDKK